MKYNLLIIFIIFTACATNYSAQNTKKPFSSKGFALIYKDEDFINKTVKRKLDNNFLQIAHNRLRPGTLIKIINLKTNDSIILKNNKKFQYPNFYKIIMTKPVAEEINLNLDLPYVEIIELKKNQSFVAKKTKIFKEEKKIHNNAPIQSVKIDNISKETKLIKKTSKKKFYIIIAEFYSNDAALLLKKRITKELPNFDVKKLLIRSKKLNKTTMLAGPYNSINLMKNDYILFKKFGFEELNISINE